jgi:hypothetical protein
MAFMVGLDGIEPSVPALKVRCFIQLSYRPNPVKQRLSETCDRSKRAAKTTSFHHPEFETTTHSKREFL